MKIQILGTGCSKCKTLTANAEKAVQELGLQAGDRKSYRNSGDYEVPDSDDPRSGD